MLDEGYYTYFDDIDFCFNAKKQGWPTWYVPASRVVHLVGQSTGVNSKPKRLPPYLLEARRRYFLKNHGPFYAAMVDIAESGPVALATARLCSPARKTPRRRSTSPIQSGTAYS